MPPERFRAPMSLPGTSAEDHRCRFVDRKAQALTVYTLTVRLSKIPARCRESRGQR